MRKNNNYMASLICDVKRDKYLYLLLFVPVVYFLIFSYMPLSGLQIAFKDYKVFQGMENSPWVGIENFKTFFQGVYFWRTLKNTLLISGYSIIFGFPIPILLALMFNEAKNRHFRSINQTITYLPHFISGVVVAGMVTNFLSPSNGVVNLFIEMLGGEKVYFLTKSEYFRRIYIIMNIWKETGFNSIIYFAALSAIDTDLYEAANIDGAGRLRRIWSITLPGILPTISTMFIMKIGNILSVSYESILLLYQPATYETSDVISTYVYRSGIIDQNYSLATAIGLFNSVVALVLVCCANYLSRKLSDSSLW